MVFVGCHDGEPGAAKDRYESLGDFGMERGQSMASAVSLEIKREKKRDVE